jgi:hypothetical protein
MTRYWGMDKEATVQIREESRQLDESWAEAEWFLEWLRLARRDYQGSPQPKLELREAA